MTTRLLALDALPRQNSTQVKNKWGDLVRQVRSAGSLAITHHSNVELVVLTAEVYQALLDTAQRQVSTPQAQIDELGKLFQERLAVLQHPTAPRRFANVMAAKGRAKKAPIAGKTY